MMPGTTRTGRLVVSILGLLILMPVYDLAGDDCEPSFEVDIANEEESNDRREYHFDVKIGITSDCAVVKYELVIETQTADGEAKTERQPGRIKLHDEQEMTQDHRFWMPLDHRMMSYEAQLIGCEGC